MRKSRVRCPNCDDVFETYAVGDVAVCDDCDRRFKASENPSWE